MTYEEKKVKIREGKVSKIVFNSVRQTNSRKMKVLNKK